MAENDRAAQEQAAQEQAAREQDLTDRVVASFDHADDERLKTVMQALTRLLRAGVEGGRLRADVDPATVMLVTGSLCAAHDHPGWKAQAQAVVRLLLDGLRTGLPT